MEPVNSHSKFLPKWTSSTLDREQSPLETIQKIKMRGQANLALSLHKIHLAGIWILMFKKIKQKQHFWETRERASQDVNYVSHKM